jgi:hypothetical protein
MGGAHPAAGLSCPPGGPGDYRHTAWAGPAIGPSIGPAGPPGYRAGSFGVRAAGGRRPGHCRRHICRRPADGLGRRAEDGPGRRTRRLWAGGRRFIKLLGVPGGALPECQAALIKLLGALGGREGGRPPPPPPPRPPGRGAAGRRRRTGTRRTAWPSSAPDTGPGPSLCCYAHHSGGREGRGVRGLGGTGRLLGPGCAPPPQT